MKFTVGSELYLVGFGLKIGPKFLKLGVFCELRLLGLDKKVMSHKCHIVFHTLGGALV